VLNLDAQRAIVDQKNGVARLHIAQGALRRVQIVQCVEMHLRVDAATQL
jgi:hypothetical protein